MATIEEMVEHVDNFRSATVRDKCRSKDDLIKLASQLAFQAAVIYENLGGKEMVAAQFYRMADDMATDKTPPLTKGEGGHG